MGITRLLQASCTLAILAILFSLTACESGDDNTATVELTSPDGSLKLYLSLGGLSSRLSYSLFKDGELIVDTSYLGITDDDWGGLEDGFELIDASSYKGNVSYDLPWGEVASVDAGYEEGKLLVRHPYSEAKFSVIACVFDDGIGIRYHFPEQEGDKTRLEVLDEDTRIFLPGNPLVNWGPGDWNSYENPTELSLHSEIDATKYDNREELISRVVPHNAIMTPATVRLENGVHLTFHEAALIDYPGMTLEVLDNLGFKSKLVDSHRRKAKAICDLPFYTPWRTIQVEDRAVDLLDNMLILNLSPPSEIEDISWFEPMTYAGVWWEMFLGVGTWDYEGGQNVDNFLGVDRGANRHAANTENAKRYIDFCAENNIGGLLIEGWNTGWEDWLDPEQRAEVFDFVTSYPDYDIEEVVRYAHEKGVQIVMHHETSASVPQYEKQQDEAFALMQNLGIHVVKSGYVGNIIPEGEYHHGQYMVNHYRNSFQKAAEYQVAVNPHEPIKPTGERRTFPNAISAEGARGMEYASSGRRDDVNQPQHLAHLVYTRCLAGPFDYTPGIFQLDISDFRGSDARVGTTLGLQLGAYVVVMAPIQMVADLPEHYKLEDGSYHPAMSYIRNMATNWDDTYPLAGELGKYAVVARKVRGEDRFFVGGISGDEDQETTLSLDFLPEGETYTLTIYRDGPDAHYWDNPTDLVIESREVTSADELSVLMKASGGFGAIIE
ncbi:MAG: glycoside hydrolase family 97 protein [Bacteroidota bacterium]